MNRVKECFLVFFLLFWVNLVVKLYRFLHLALGTHSRNEQYEKLDHRSLHDAPTPGGRKPIGLGVTAVSRSPTLHTLNQRRSLESVGEPNSSVVPRESACIPQRRWAETANSEKAFSCEWWLWLGFHKSVFQEMFSCFHRLGAPHSRTTEQLDLTKNPPRIYQNPCGT